MSGPYLASEDSALLRKVLGGYEGERCLEIGAGNAGNITSLARRFTLAVGTDLVKPTMNDWKEGGANFVLADKAGCFRDGVFDLVAFNPPYLAVNVGDDVSVEGGERLEVPMLFLRDAFRVVTRQGRVLMLLDEGADESEFEETAAERGFAIREVASRHLFFGRLLVYELICAQELRLGLQS